MTFGPGSHLHLIDGSAFIFRAYHALPPLTRKSDGLPVGAVAGFCNMLFRYVSGNSGPDAASHVAVIFDHSAKTFRNQIYDQYKAHRPETPEDLRPQFPLTRDATRAFNIEAIETEGFEADDLIASYACRARAAGGRVTIISSDKDLMQLVGEGVEMLDPMKNRRIGREEVFEKFGVYPERVVDVQALAGDSVDNVPGAPGIGIKTAALLITEFGDLETLLARAGEIKQPKRRQVLQDHAEMIRISRALVALDCDMALEQDLDSLAIRPAAPEQLMDFLNLMEFRTLTRRVAESLGATPPAPVSPPATAAPAAQGADRGRDPGADADWPALAPAAIAPENPAFDPSLYELVTTPEALASWVAAIAEAGVVAIDTETTSLDEMRADLVGISLALAPGRACYIPLGHRGAAPDAGAGGAGAGAAAGDLFADPADDALLAGQLPLDQALAALRPVLEDPAVLKVLQNAKYDMKILARHGLQVGPIDDTMLISYALHSGLHGHGMDLLSQTYLDHTPIPIKSLLGSGKAQITFDRVPLDQALTYAAEDADITLRLWRILKPRLHQARVTTVYETLERPLVPVLAQMERDGIQVDRDTLSRMSNAFAQTMAGLEAEVHELAGAPFNLASPKQLGEILFDKLGVPGGKKGKTGAYATGADVLEDIASEGENPTARSLAARLLDWRQIAKLKSTYTDALQGHIHPETGRVHTSYSIAGAATGRLASTDPNLQNIPVRSDEGRRIREAFVAPPGKRLVSLDYSQIELRILAHVADIPALKEAFRDGIDIHAMTASQMFNVPLEGMDPMVRRQAKAINFGVIYGISGFGLARNLRIPRAEAQAFIDTYFRRFPGIREYMDATVAFAQAHGHVETLFGRKIHTPEINAKGPTAGFARRAAINAPIQGAAADIIRRAMVRMPAAIADLPARMLLQVHDELLFEVDEAAVDPLIARARAVMEAAAEPAITLDVPLVVDAGHGLSWAAAH